MGPATIRSGQLIGPVLKPALQPFRPPAACFARESGCFFILHLHFPRLCPPFMAAASAITPLPSIVLTLTPPPSLAFFAFIASAAASLSGLLAAPFSLSSFHGIARSGNTSSTTQGAPYSDRLHFSFWGFPACHSTRSGYNRVISHRLWLHPHFWPAILPNPL